jgi:hypothetical protein
LPARLIARETIGSFLTRLAFANSLRIPHLLALAAITTGQRSFTPATDDTRGWPESTPGRIAALAGRPLAELAAAIPLLATMTPADTAPLRACGHCTAAKNVTGMVITRARARDYLCLRHQQWLRASTAPAWRPCPKSPAASAATTGAPRTSPTRTLRAPAGRPGTSPASGWHPDGIPRSPSAGRTGTAAWPPCSPGPEAVLTDVITHPEMLSVARLLISSHRSPGIRPWEIAARLGFRYPTSPHPPDPLQNHLSR